MKTKLILALLLIFAATDVSAFRCGNTSHVRIVFSGCHLTGTVRVKFGDIEATLPVTDGVAEGMIRGNVDDSGGYPLRLPAATKPCCATAPLPEWTENCVLQYAFYCDERNPAWGLTVSSSDRNVHFEFVTYHLDDYNASACMSRAQVDTNSATVSDLGTHDAVEIKITRGDRPLVTIPAVVVALEAFTSGSISISRQKLEDFLTQATQQSNQSSSGSTRDWTSAAKAALPNDVTVVRK